MGFRTRIAVTFNGDKMHMTYNPENSKRTAISRTMPSKPLRILLSKDLLNKDDTILDYGCGKGKDIEHLKSLGFRHVIGFDPYNPKYAHPENLIPDYDTILNFYVLNVLLPEERDLVVENLMNLIKEDGQIFIAVRDYSENVMGTQYADGVLTSRGTFQKLFSPEELIEYILEIYPEGTEIQVISRHPFLVRITL